MKMSKRESSNEGRLTREQKLIIETMREELDVNFEVIHTPVEFPASSKDVEWLMRCRTKEQIEKSPFLNTVWKQREGGYVWLESLVLGDTVEWIENAYDEEGAAASIDIDYARLDEEGFRSEFGSRFPLVLDRIMAYQEIASRFSSESGARLEIRRSGSKGILVFTLAARTHPLGDAPAPFVQSLKNSASALAGAYAEIMQV